MVIENKTLSSKSYRVIFPSSLYSNISSINNILRQFNQITPEYTRIYFDTTNLKWIDSEVSALIGALFENLKTRLPGVEMFLYHHMDPSDPEKLLFKNNFLEYYLEAPNYHAKTTGYTVKFDVLKLTPGVLEKNDLKNISEYLNNQLFSHPQWENNFENLENQLGFSEAIFELARNISDHSKSENIIFAGQYYPTKNEFRLSIADNGLGIPFTVKTGAKVFGEDAALIDWATQPGNTSKDNAHPRGMGLSTIKSSLIGVGELIIVSGNGFWRLNKDGKVETSTLKQKFNGTYVRLSFLNDRIKQNKSKNYQTMVSENLPF